MRCIAITNEVLRNLPFPTITLLQQLCYHEPWLRYSIIRNGSYIMMRFLGHEIYPRYRDRLNYAYETNFLPELQSRVDGYMYETIQSHNSSRQINRIAS